MAPDDDDRRWRQAQDERRRLEERTSEKTRQLNEALRDKDWDQARWITGVPPPDAGYESPEEPERTDPPTAGEQFREHRQALLFNLEWADRFLPRELLEDWAMRTRRLDIEEAEAGLAAIEVLRDEYQRAVDRYEPPVTEVSRRVDWDYHVPRIGDEIRWVIALFRHVLTFE